MDKLKDLSLEYTLHLLKQHNNQLNDQHVQAIEQIITGMVAQLEGKKSRKAFPLACGLGKTTCIRGLLLAIYHLGLDHSIVISAGQIEALCSLKKDLLSDGVPEEKIGLLHSKQYSPEKEPNEVYASLPSNTKDEIEERPFVLVTHNKIKHNKTWINSYYTYQEKERDLVIWDESLISGQATTLSVLNIINSIDSVINGFEIGSDKNETFRELVSFLTASKEILKDAKEEKDFSLSFPSLTFSLIKARQQINYLVTNNDTRDLMSLIECLVHDGELRYIKEDNGAIISFRQSVPDELDNIVILDASHCLREITKCDPTIQIEQISCPKSYENLTIKYFKSGAGRNTVENEFFGKRESKLVDELAEIIFAILTQRPGEPVLIWSYKSRGNKSIEEKIKKRLKDMITTIDFNAVDASGNKIINFQTFGNELGLNGYTHCKHSIFIGLLYLKRSFVAGMIKGQSRDMNKDVSENNLLSDAVMKEQAHTFYQAVSRGSSRITDNGKCKEQIVYFFHSSPSKIKRIVNEVFPMAKWERYNAIHLNNKDGLYSEIAGKVNERLNMLTESDFLKANPRSKAMNEISTQALRKAYFQEIERHQWTNSLRVFKDDYPWDWEIQKQSFVKLG